MTRSKRASHTRPTNPIRPISRIYAHTTPTCNGPRYQRHYHLNQVHNRKLRTSEGDPEDTYLSFLRGIHDTEDDKESSDGTNIDASSDDQEWDEETTLVEILGSPYSILSPPYSLDFCSSDSVQCTQ